MIHGVGFEVRHEIFNLAQGKINVSRLLRLLTVLMLPWSLLVFAQEQSADAADVPPPPPLPPKVQNEQLEPTVEIRKVDDKIVEEYSINGRVYMVKVTPENGPPYYYLDEDGNGELRLQPGDDALNPVRPAFWKVKEWK